MIGRRCLSHTIPKVEQEVGIVEDDARLHQSVPQTANGHIFCLICSDLFSQLGREYRAPRVIRTLQDHCRAFAV
jgi:stress-induced morphogen